MRSKGNMLKQCCYRSLRENRKRTAVTIVGIVMAAALRLTDKGKAYQDSDSLPALHIRFPLSVRISGYTDCWENISDIPTALPDCAGVFCIYLSGGT